MHKSHLLTIENILHADKVRLLFILAVCCSCSMSIFTAASTEDATCSCNIERQALPSRGFKLPDKPVIFSLHVEANKPLVERTTYSAVLNNYGNTSIV